MLTRLAAFWRSLTDCNQPRIRYLGRALLADLPVAFAVGLVLNQLTGTTWPVFPLESLPRVLLALCVFAPLVETFAMTAIIWVLRRILRRTEYVPLVTALICAGLHSLSKSLWGLEVFWSFVIFSLCYVTWAKKSPLQAFWLTALLHALHNLLPLLVLVAMRAGR